MGYKSYVKQAKQQLKKSNSKGLEGIAKFAQQKAQDRASVQAGKSADGVYKSKSKTPEHSPPGTYRKTIKATSDDDTIILGTNDLLGLFLEEGTRTAPAYPHLKPAFDENPAEIVQILKEAHRGN